MAAGTGDWHPPAAYLYTLTLDRPSLAWEYLRRNPRYREDFARRLDAHAHDGAGAGELASAWGLQQLEDPARDAREVQPVWLAAPADVAQLHPDAAATPSARAFALWALPGRKQLTHDGNGLLLTTQRADGALCLALAPSLEHGMAYAYAVPAAPDVGERWRALAATIARVEGNDAAAALALARERPDRIALQHMRSLQALDGLAAGASQRAIAQAVFGADVVAARWEPDSELRALVRRLIRHGQSSVDGGYRRLLQPPLSGEGRSS